MSVMCYRLDSAPPASDPLIQALQARNAGSLENSAGPCWTIQEVGRKHGMMTVLFQQTWKRWGGLINKALLLLQYGFTV